MESQMVWRILGIQPTQDKSSIKERYHERLTEVNPEDDAEGFKRLREAYEEAMRQAEGKGQSDTAEHEEKEKDEIDLWLDKAEQVYWYIDRRNDIEQWKQLLEDPVCMALDTSLEARERFLAFLMTHNYLKQEVWKLINREFQVEQDKEELAEQFPRNFLDYVIYQVENENFMTYESIEIRGLDEAQISVDDYLHEYFEIKAQIDRQQYEGCRQRLEQLKDYEVYHPYEDVERMRLLIQENQKAEAVALGERMQKTYADDVYVGFWAGRAYWSNEQWEEAYQCWQHVMECLPDHYTARVGLIQYYMKKEDFLKAKELIMEILEINGRDEMVLGFMREVNEHLIGYYWEMAKKEPEVRKPAVEACWCMFQNEQFQETIAELKQLDIRPEEPEYYDYVNMMGRCYLSLEDNENAVIYLKKWNEEWEKLVDDGSEKYQKRQKREGFIKSVIGVAYQNMKQYEQAEYYLKQGIEKEAEAYVRHSFMDRLALLYYDFGEYEKCIETATNLIKEDAGYYPAYLRRQMAYYEMRNGQKVVDDYYRAVEIFPNYYKPYLLAVEVFCIYRQYEDAKKVLDAAAEHGVKQVMLEYWRVRIQRMQAESPEAYEKALELCQKLREEIKKQERDKKAGQKSEEEALDEFAEQEGMPEDQLALEDLIYEEILIQKDAEHYDQALALVQYELARNGRSYRLHRIKGDCLREKEQYEQALQEYHILRKEFPQEAQKDGELPYYCGICYKKLGREEQACSSFQAALERNPKHPRAHYELMQIYKHRYMRYELPEAYKQAVEEAGLQLQVSPYAYNYIERGILYMENYEFDKALADYKKAIELEPEDAYGYMNMGDVLRIQGNYKEAIACYRNAIKRLDESDKNLRPYDQLAKCYEAIGEIDKKIQVLTKASDVFGPRRIIVKALAETYRNKRQPEEAIRLYEEAWKKDLLNKEEYYDYRAKVYIVEGNLSEAKRLYETFMKQSRKGNQTEDKQQALQDKADALEDLGVFYMFQRKLKKAIKYLKPSFEMRKKYHLRADWSGRNLALAYLLSHQYAKAKNVAQEVLNILIHERKLPEALAAQGMKTVYSVQAYTGNYKPLAPARMDEVARMYICMRKYEQAEELLRQAETMPKCHHCERKECYDMWISRAYIEEAKGNLEQALACYQRCMETNPGDSEVVLGILALEQKLKK